MSNVLPFPRAGGAKDEQIVLALALMVAGIALPEQVSAVVNIPTEALFGLLDDSQMQRVVDAEVLRLRHSGKLADLKAEVLTNRMLDKLLAADADEMSTGIAIKIAELGLKFRNKSPEHDLPKAKFSVVVRMPGDPKPELETENGIIIDLSHTQLEGRNA